ncbi:MAG: tRNA (adenosine(37)-N6)-dimethylallyltransferase MiaA, partial [Candidatus Saccharimonadales bacterium]
MVAGQLMNAPLIGVVGSTATGKSQLALKLAQSLNGEIVSADSWLVRRGVDIGSAKPSLIMQSKVPHHLIDIIDPGQDFTAAEYKKLAKKAIADIQSRGKLPILVGGTGLYIDAVLYDYSFLGAADSKERQRLNSLTLDELHSIARSKGLDLSSIDTRNKRRVIRLIESNGGVATKSSLRPDTLVIGVVSQPSSLHHQITKRVESMINQGLEEEVRGLSDKYGWDCEGLKGIGYSEWRLYFNDHQSLETTKERIIKDTVALAKRQGTWFKRNKSIHWLDNPVNWQQVVALV